MKSLIKSNFSTPAVRLKILSVLIGLFIFLWPFIYCLPVVSASDNRYTAIGNDFDILYFNYKYYLLNSLSEGHFPLWSPAEAAGYPFYSNPFAEAFYPLNIPLFLFYKINGGYTRFNHQQFTVLGIAIFALGLYFWLKQFRLNPRAVIFAALLIPISFKMIEILRFPNAVHTAAWYPWILFLLTSLVFSPSMKRQIFYAGLLIFCCVCFLTAGYVYYNYYGLFLLVPYTLILLIPALRTKFFGERPVKLRTSIALLAAVGIITLSLCGPYLLKVSSLMKSTVDRGGNSFEYSTEHVFDLEDTAGSLVFPPSAQAEGWYYFGIFSVLLIVLYIFSPLYIKRDAFTTVDAAPPWYLSRWVKIILLVWIAIIAYITFGKNSLLFTFLWYHFPGFSSLRIWGRMNIILVPLWALLLAIAYTHFEHMLISPRTKLNIGKALIILLVSYGIIFGIQMRLFTTHEYDPYWAYFPAAAGIEPGFILTGFLSLLLILLIATSVRLRGKPALTAGLCCAVALVTIDVHGLTTEFWMWTAGRTPVPQASSSKISDLDRASLGVNRIDGDGTISLGPNFSVGIVPNWYFSRYVTFLNQTQGEIDQRKILLGVTKPQRLFYSTEIHYNTVQAFLTDAGKFEPFQYTVRDYNGDNLVLDVPAPADGYLSFIDNWDDGWVATVDGNPVPIELLFGTFKSVKLTAGMHHVTFSYRPSLW